MPRIRNLPFRFAHYESMRLAGDVGLPLTRDLARNLATDGAMRTLAVEGQPLVVLGINSREGVTFAWAYLDQDVPKHLLALVRLGRRLLDDAHGRLPTISAGALVDNPEGHRLLKILGFEMREGPNGLVSAPRDPNRVYQLYDRHKPAAVH